MFTLGKKEVKGVSPWAKANPFAISSTQSVELKPNEKNPFAENKMAIAPPTFESKTKKDIRDNYLDELQTEHGDVEFVNVEEFELID